jgi:hypothetical protein
MGFQKARVGKPQARITRVLQAPRRIRFGVLEGTGEVRSGPRCSAAAARRCVVLSSARRPRLTRGEYAEVHEEPEWSLSPRATLDRCPTTIEADSRNDALNDIANLDDKARRSETLARPS